MLDHERPPVGTLVISIDLSDDNERPGAVDRQVAASLMQFLQGRRMPATWTLADPGPSPLSREILAAPGNHEVALLGQRGWAGNGVTRTTFARSLAQRLSDSKQAGIRVSTLALRTTDLAQNLDLLVKHRMSVIRGRLDHVHGEAAQFQPHSLRFGVWYAPVSRRLPRRTWSLVGARWWWRQTIQRACQRSGFAHLAIDLTALQQQDRALKDVQLALEVARRMRDEGRVRIQTLQQLAQRLIRRRPHQAARSILHVA